MFVGDLEGIGINCGERVIQVRIAFSIELLGVDLVTGPRTDVPGLVVSDSPPSRSSATRSTGWRVGDGARAIAGLAGQGTSDWIGVAAIVACGLKR